MLAMKSEGKKAFAAGGLMLIIFIAGFVGLWLGLDRWTNLDDGYILLISWCAWAICAFLITLAISSKWEKRPNAEHQDD